MTIEKIIFLKFHNFFKWLLVWNCVVWRKLKLQKTKCPYLSNGRIPFLLPKIMLKIVFWAFTFWYFELGDGVWWIKRDIFDEKHPKSAYCGICCKNDVIKILENKSRLQVYVISLTFVPLGLNATAYVFVSSFLFVYWIIS